MPLAPLPENNTDHIWLKYSTYGQEHEIVFRFPSVVPQADQAAAAHDFAVAFAPYVPTGDAFLGVRHQDSGSALSFPLPFAPVPGTGAAPAESDDRTKFISIVGRSLGGYRCRLTFFMPYPVDTLNFRVNRASGNIADDFLSTVEAMEPAPVAIDGAAVVWLQYCNIGYNAYWQRRLRP